MQKRDSPGKVKSHSKARKEADHRKDEAGAKRLRARLSKVAVETQSERR